MLLFDRIPEIKGDYVVVPEYSNKALPVVKVSETVSVTCPKCGTNKYKDITMNVIRPKPSYNCNICDIEFRDNEIIVIDIQKQLDENWPVLYFGKSMFCCTKAYKMMVIWNKKQCDCTIQQLMIKGCACNGI